MDKVFFKQNRIQISKVLYAFILSMIVFSVLLKEIRLDVFLIIYIGFLSLVLIVLEHKINAKHIFEMIVFGTAVSGGYITVKLLTDHITITTFFNWDKNRIIMVSIIVLEYLYILGLQIIKHKCVCNAVQRYESPMQRTLFQERRDDIKRLEQYIEIFDTIGIQGNWGSGKTYLVDEFIKMSKNKYEVIKIETLTCNLDTIESYIFKQLENVLWRNGIYPSYSRQIQNLLEDNSLSRKLQSVLFKGSSDRMTVFQGFCQDITKLQKTILLVCEDIDRISENYVDQIARILDISAKLSGNNVKVLYEYDQKKMTTLGFQKDYMEKYIPYVINLTNIPFMKMICQALEEETILNGGLCEDDFRFLTLHIFVDHFLSELFEIRSDLFLQLNGIEPRKIKEFVSEVNLAMKNAEYAVKENKKVTIVFYYIKIFMWEFFDELSFFDDLQEEVMFEKKVNENGILKSYYYDIMELTNLLIHEKIAIEEVRQMFVSGKNEKEDEYITCNRNKLGILLLLGFNFKSLKDMYDKKIAKKTRYRRNPILDEDLNDVHKIERNSKINSLIKNLYMNGKSEYTDSEANARVFINTVLLSEDSRREDNWKKYLKKCYFSQIYKDNSSVFMFMGDAYLSLAKALRTIIHMPEYTNRRTLIKGKFIDFWREHIGEDTSIILETVQALRFVEPESNNDFIKAITFFNNLKVVGNMNTEKAYAEFLDTYISTACRLGYVYNCFYYHELKGIDGLEDKTGELLREILEEVRRHLEKDLDNKCYPTSAEGNIREFKKFLNKNLELISAPEKNMWKRPKVKTSVSEEISYVNKNVYLRLKSIAEAEDISVEKYRELLDEEYNKGNLNLLEYRQLLNQSKRQTTRLN